MTNDVRLAIYQLGECAKRLSEDDDMPDHSYELAYRTLVNAIRHLAYPDRDVYPKTRRGLKVRPIMQVGHRWLK